MANYKKERWSMGAAAMVVAAALALSVGVFIFFSNKYSGNEETQVTQIPLAPGNELPIAPITPPASPPVTTPYNNPPVSQ
jgi:hypothetical protein